ncbi:hypothetical protein [Candidatus Aquiluna sp. UB-MaderosW2red]|jgi:hypothetical protein|uniref:hypothetical protein n=1 Tax=Candidatus Aquiluna sp. UB-MaderosW2red TaxID=1855377 RepID=UPI000875B5A4|nr:hypothetical protein [Candidatus Aquiluna sp. UB-MaderosW2red]SCX07739.1 hypothetical protein SAMN05216534_0667 [Candidatus Aquiluna sp. UB-MaderosW2red]
MQQFKAHEITELLSVSPADEFEQAAALAVVTAAIQESRRLGRIALGKPKTTWHKNPAMLRSSLHPSWSYSPRSSD